MNASQDIVKTAARSSLDTAPCSPFLSLIAKVEKSHFRTKSDTGANECAMFVWNQVRKEAGLLPLRLSDLRAWDGTEYVMPPHSRLLENVNVEASDVEQPVSEGCFPAPCSPHIPPLSYPEHYPVKDSWDPEAPENESWRPCWEEPLRATTQELVEKLLAVAQSLEDEHGLCHKAFCIREAAHRL